MATVRVWREASVEAGREAVSEPIPVKAWAVCNGCGSNHAFTIEILACGCKRVRCVCGEVWEAPDWRSGDYARGHEAVAGGEHEPCDVVQAAARKALEYVMPQFGRDAYRVTRFDKKAYMREYMRRRRAKQKTGEV
jgi:hypothetical protein